MTDQERVPRGISEVADKIGITGQQLADVMGPAFTSTMAWLEGDSHDIHDLVDTLHGAPAPDTPEAHDVGDGFEMSAAECAAWVDELIREQESNVEASLDDKEALRRWQEVSYHLHWHCVNLDGN